MSEEVIGSSPILTLYFLFIAKGESMSIEELRLILCDMFIMDAWQPPLLWKWRDDFKKASYSKWAVQELQDYIADALYPCEYGPIEKFSKLTYEFMMKMSDYAHDSDDNDDMRLIFQTASSVAADILDLLNAMQ